MRHSKLRLPRPALTYRIHGAAGITGLPTSTTVDSYSIAPIPTFLPMAADVPLVTAVTALAGVVTGTAGLMIGILNYLRDRPSVVVTLTWDMEPFGGAEASLDAKRAWGVLTVANTGRRPIFVSHASLHVPSKSRYFLIRESVEGAKLLESDPPKRYMIDQEALGQRFTTEWRRLRGCVVDNTGRHWHSAPINAEPSWANRTRGPSEPGTTSSWHSLRAWGWPRKKRGHS